MSIISSQIDELRNAAEFYDGFKAANLMREAADTICELHDGLQQANAENAKLRELAERAWKAAKMLCQAWDGPCRADGVSIMKPCPMMERDELCVYGLIQLDLREMGIEVDG